MDQAYSLGLNDAAVNRLAFQCEQAAHGTPSGIDNTVATYGMPLLFENAKRPTFRELKIPQPLPLVIGITGRESLTATTVARVRAAWEGHKARFEAIFEQMGQLTRAATEALADARLQELGQLMNLCQGYLNALQVSTPELEELIHLSRANGALGAKLTGGGGGGSMIALCPDAQKQVADAIQAAGYKALQATIGG